MSKFSWICEVRGIVRAKAEGTPSYGGSYKAVYFDDFKALAVKRGDGWQLVNRSFPLNFRGGVYGMAKAIGL